MLIINPIYDQAFKYMMDNEEVAKKIISIILDKEVKSIQPKPRETKVYNEKRDIPLSRFDFKAIIKDDDDNFINVLIEIQKSNKPDPIMRFRRYLGKNYIRKETIINKNGVEELVAIPIITIYILGYNMPEYNTPALKVNNQVIDLTTKKEESYKNEFIKLLTHPSFILQTERLREDRKTKIERFIAIFDQKTKTENDYILDVSDEEEDEDINQIKDYLHRATQDEEIILQLELEEDVEAEFEKMEKEKEEAKRKVKKAKQKAKKAKQKAKEERSLKEEAKERIIELARTLKELNLSEKEIVRKTGLTKDEIEKL